MNVRYRVELSQVERSDLKALLSGGKHASRKLKRAQILLAADAGGRRRGDRHERRRERLNRVPVSRRAAKMAEELDYIPIPVVKLIENTWPVEIKS